jgi:hypothetical protein
MRHASSSSSAPPGGLQGAISASASAMAMDGLLLFTSPSPVGRKEEAEVACLEGQGIYSFINWNDIVTKVLKKITITKYHCIFILFVF